MITINKNNEGTLANSFFGYNGKEHKTMKILRDITSLYPQLKRGRQTTHHLNVQSQKITTYHLYLNCRSLLNKSSMALIHLGVDVYNIKKEMS